jgi:hypothetical protein
MLWWQGLSPGIYLLGAWYLLLRRLVEPFTPLLANIPVL